MNTEPETSSVELKKSCDQAAGFLDSVFASARLDLRTTVQETVTGLSLNIYGSDSELLLNDAGDLLDALQHLVNQAFGRSLPRGNRIICDVQSFRATRAAELRAMANHAAGRVRATGLAFTFGPMSASERRIIHLTLAESSDLHTESMGDGLARKLRVSLRSPT